MKEIFLRKDGKTDYCSYAPDVLFGVDMGWCCKLHDENYDYLESDIELKENIKFAFTDDDKRIIGTLVANLYYIAVKIYRKVKYRNHPFLTRSEQ